MTKRWFVGVTKQNGELLAARNLRNQGYIVYLPKRYVPQDAGRRANPLGMLRFTGYIFIAFDLEMDEHGPISNTRGMEELLLTGQGEPEAISTKIVEDLRGIEDDDFDIARTRSKPSLRNDLRAGDEVIVVSRGHLADGKTGHYIGSDEKGVANVLVGSMFWRVLAFDLKKIDRQNRKIA